MRPFRTQTNYNYKEERGEKNTLPDETVPNEAYSIRELLAQHVRGVPLPIGRIPTYSNSDDFDDFDETRRPDFDLADASMQMRLVNEEIAEKKAAAKRKQAEPVKVEVKPGTPGGSGADDPVKGEA